MIEYITYTNTVVDPEKYIEMSLKVTPERIAEIIKQLEEDTLPHKFNMTVWCDYRSELCNTVACIWGSAFFLSNNAFVGRNPPVEWFEEYDPEGNYSLLFSKIATKEEIIEYYKEIFENG